MGPSQRTQLVSTRVLSAYPGLDAEHRRASLRRTNQNYGRRTSVFTGRDRRTAQSHHIPCAATVVCDPLGRTVPPPPTLPRHTPLRLRRSFRKRRRRDPWTALALTYHILPRIQHSKWGNGVSWPATSTTDFLYRGFHLYPSPSLAVGGMVCPYVGRCYPEPAG